MPKSTAMLSKFVQSIGFVCLLFILSCNKEQERPDPSSATPPKSLGEMVTCHNTVTWDSASIRNKLVGSWQWKYIRCYWNPEDANGDDYQTMRIEFKNNNTLEVKNNDTLVQTSQWKIINLNDGFFKVESTPLVYYIPGRIVFCDSMVLFNDSYVDGCDNYFTRVD